MRTLDYIVLAIAGIFAIKFVLPMFKQAVSYAAEEPGRREMYDNVTGGQSLPGFGESGNPNGSDPKFSAPPSSSPPTEAWSFARDKGPYKYLTPADEAKMAAKHRQQYREKTRHQATGPIQDLGNYLSHRLNQMFGVVPPITGMPVAPPVLAYAAADDEVATMKQRPVGNTKSTGAGAVSESAWACITHRERLQVINNNATLTGTVIAAGDGGPHYAPDGDLVFAFKPDPPYANMVNEVNKSNKKYAGGLWMEGVCQKANKAKEPRHQGDCKCSPPKFAAPKNGDRLRITGAHVKDVGEEGHNEVHPIYTMEKIA